MSNSEEKTATAVFIVPVVTSVLTGQTLVQSESPPLTPLSKLDDEERLNELKAAVQAVNAADHARMEATKETGWMSLFSPTRLKPGKLVEKVQTKFPKKSILKPNKPINFDALAVLPPPIQRTVVISPREMRKLSHLPPLPVDYKQRTVRVAFHENVQVCEAWQREEYDRGSIEFTARHLTPSMAHAIKIELNAVKAEMDVHEESKCNTQFYRV